MDEAKVQSDAENLFMGSMGMRTGQKTKPRPNHLPRRRLRARLLKPELSVLQTEDQLHLGGGGGLGGLGLFLRLGGAGRLVLGESKACGAEEERKAEHRGHDLFHRVFLLEIRRL